MRENGYAFGISTTLTTKRYKKLLTLYRQPSPASGCWWVAEMGWFRNIKSYKFVHLEALSGVTYLEWRGKYKKKIQNLSSFHILFLLNFHEIFFAFSSVSPFFLLPFFGTKIYYSFFLCIHSLCCCFCCHRCTLNIRIFPCSATQTDTRTHSHRRWKFCTFAFIILFNYLFCSWEKWVKWENGKMCKNLIKILQENSHRVRSTPVILVPSPCVNITHSIPFSCSFPSSEICATTFSGS